MYPNPCSGCGRMYKKTYPHRARIVNGYTFENYKLCPLGSLCESVLECHATIGIGVATLGTRCGFVEDHKGDHSYNSLYCNTHKGPCSG